MALSSDVALDITTACVCGALILARLAYRVLFRCKLHPTCHRTWRIDDFYMTIAILPLIGRCTCISWSFLLNQNHTYEPATEAEALAQGVTVDQLNHDRILSHKLLIPGRICYALLCVKPRGGFCGGNERTLVLTCSSLWCLKLGLLAFYTRFVGVFRWGSAVANALWGFIAVTFIAVLITTLTECHPLSLYVALDCSHCWDSTDGHRMWKLHPPDDSMADTIE